MQIRLPESNLPPLPIAQLSVAFLSFTWIGVSGGSLGVLIPVLQIHYGVDKAVISLTFLCSTAGYLTASLLCGILFEKLGQVRFLLVGTLLITGGMGGASLIPPFFLFVLLLFPVGFGFATLDAGFNAHISLLPRSNRLLNYLHAFFGVGALLGPLLVSTILLNGGSWNSVYVLGSIIGICVFFGIKMTFTPVKQTSLEKKEIEHILPAVLHLPLVWICAFIFFFYVGIEVSLGSWSYSYLIEVQRASPLFATWIASGYWVGLTLGRTLMGTLIQQFGARRVIFWCLIGVFCGLFSSWFVPFRTLSPFGLCFAGFCLGPIYPTIISIMPSLVPVRLLTGSIGFIVSLGCVGGAFFPWVVGNIAQAYNIVILLPFISMLVIVLGILWIILHTYHASTESEPFSD